MSWPFLFEKGRRYVGVGDKPDIIALSTIVNAIEGEGFAVEAAWDCENEGGVPFQVPGVCGDDYDTVAMLVRTGPTELIDVPDRVVWIGVMGKAPEPATPPTTWHEPPPPKTPTGPRRAGAVAAVLVGAGAGAGLGAIAAPYVRAERTAGGALGALVGGGAALAGLFAARKPLLPKCPPPGAGILLLGDSLAVGLEAPLRTHAKRCGAPLVAAVKGGTGAPYWRSRVAALVAQHQPTAVVISLGGNDYKRASWGADEHAKVAASIAEIVAAVRGAGALLLWVHPPPIPWPDAGGVVGMWRSHRVAEFFTLGEKDIPYQPDGIHPTGKGYRMLAERMWPWISRETVRAS